MSVSQHTPAQEPDPATWDPQDPEALPLRAGCWVATGEGSSLKVARVKACVRSDGKILLDLYMYDTKGNNLGRTSPAMGGPRTFEPCCDFEGWRRIEEPAFPLSMGWVPSPGDPARRTMGYSVKTIPFGRFMPRKAKAPARVPAARPTDYDPALEAASRRMSAQELRDAARDLPPGSRQGLLDRAARLEAEADRIAPRH